MALIRITHLWYTSPTIEGGSPTGRFVKVAGQTAPVPLLESTHGDEVTSEVMLPPGMQRAELRRVIEQLVANRFPDGSVIAVEGDDEGYVKEFRTELNVPEEK